MIQTEASDTSATDRDKLYVEPAARNRGIGSSSTRAAIEAADAERVEGLPPAIAHTHRVGEADMKVGIALFHLRPDSMALVPRRAEALGFGSVWVPEHLVLPTRIASRYPYGAG